MGVRDFLSKTIDTLTDYIVQVSGDHSYIHKGKGYSLVGLTGDIAADGTYEISFRTPDPDDPAVLADRAYIHWRPAFFGGIESGVMYQLYEGSTGITGGTSAVPGNRNRNVRIQSQMADVKIGVSVSTDGTFRQVGIAGSGGGIFGSSGGGDGSDLEIVLKPDTFYTVKFTNTSSSNATKIVYELFWYEERGYKA